MEKLQLSENMAVKVGRFSDLPALEFHHVHEGSTFIGFLYGDANLKKVREGIDEAIGPDYFAQLAEINKKNLSELQRLEKINQSIRQELADLKALMQDQSLARSDDNGDHNE